jgi:hypothetical protein
MNPEDAYYLFPRTAFRSAALVKEIPLTKAIALDGQLPRGTNSLLQTQQTIQLDYALL